MTLHPDLTDLLGAFSSSNVEYLIVGGWAVSIHAEPRFTKDLDLLIGESTENLARVAQALALFGAPPDIVNTAVSPRSSPSRALEVSREPGTDALVRVLR